MPQLRSDTAKNKQIFFKEDFIPEKMEPFIWITDSHFLLDHAHLHSEIYFFHYKEETTWNLNSPSAVRFVALLHRQFSVDTISASSYSLLSLLPLGFYLHYSPNPFKFPITSVFNFTGHFFVPCWITSLFCLEFAKELAHQLATREAQFINHLLYVWHI